jgi:hypothetical protein
MRSQPKTLAWHSISWALVALLSMGLVISVVAGV